MLTMFTNVMCAIMVKYNKSKCRKFNSGNKHIITYY